MRLGSPNYRSQLLVSHPPGGTEKSPNARGRGEERLGPAGEIGNWLFNEQISSDPDTIPRGHELTPPPFSCCYCRISSELAKQITHASPFFCDPCPGVCPLLVALRELHSEMTSAPAPSVFEVYLELKLTK